MSYIVPTIQGSALVFNPSGIENLKLYVELVRERMIMLHNYRGCLIDNTNLHCLPLGCLRVLIAYSVDTGKKLKEVNWNLDFLINLNPFHMVILPLVNLGEGEFQPFGEVATLNCFKTKITRKYVTWIRSITTSKLLLM